MGSPGQVRPNQRNARTHSQKQVRQIAESIKAFGFNNPLLIDEHGTLLAGHGRLSAAKHLGLPAVPVVRVSDLSEAEKRAYVLADNKLAMSAGWDRELLTAELGELSVMLPELDLDIEITGFAVAEYDELVADAEEDRLNSKEDAAPEDDTTCLVSRPGDLWQLGKHRLICGDARDPDAMAKLLDGERANLMFADPPFNVPVEGHVMGRGRIKHPDFVMGSGEMTTDEFKEFLHVILSNAARVSHDGALHFVVMDWRHLEELYSVARGIYGEMKNLIVWAKTNAGQGSLYRSQHELIGLWKVGNGPHINNIQLGKYGRNRSNIWTYPGINTFKAGRDQELRSHPTVKPVALVADAIKDLTKQGAIVLDPFSGSGTTLIAAEKTGRRARVLELDPRYADVAVRRFEAFTGKDAIHLPSGRTFGEIASEREISVNTGAASARASDSPAPAARAN